MQEMTARAPQERAARVLRHFRGSRRSGGISKNDDSQLAATAQTVRGDPKESRHIKARVTPPTVASGGYIFAERKMTKKLYLYDALQDNWTQFVEFYQLILSLTW